MLGGESSFLYWFLTSFLFYCGLIRFFFFLVSLNGTAHSISRLRSLSLVDSRWERKDRSTKSFRLPVNATELICIARDALKLLSLTLPSCQELQKHSFRPLSHPLYDERLLSGVEINKPVLRRSPDFWASYDTCPLWLKNAYIKAMFRNQLRPLFIGDWYAEEVSLLPWRRYCRLSHDVCIW